MVSEYTPLFEFKKFLEINKSIVFQACTNQVGVYSFYSLQSFKLNLIWHKAILMGYTVNTKLITNAKWYGIQACKLLYYNTLFLLFREHKRTYETSPSSRYHLTQSRTTLKKGTSNSSNTRLNLLTYFKISFSSK